MTIDRREVVTGLAAGTAVAGLWWQPADAMTAPALFAGTPLASNRLAGKVQRFDRPLPDVPVLTATGEGSLAKVGGKTRLLSLWSDWCAPCLVEIRDFARLRSQVMTDRFDIGLVALGGDRTKALAKLAQFGAAGMPLLVDLKARSAFDLAVPLDAKPSPGGAPSGFTLPCTLLVSSAGRVKGRMFGAPDDVKRSPEEMGRPLSDADKADLLTHGRTTWSSPDGMAFFRALGDGIIDKV